MSVDFRKNAHILAVHGVQSGEAADINSDDQIRELVKRSLSRSHLQREFEVPDFFYEDINDNAQRFYKAIAGAILRGNPLAGRLLRLVIDLAGDVVTAARNTSTAWKIRNRLRREILRSYDDGHQLVLVAHSLGSIYAVDVIGGLMRKDGFFVGDNRSTWPVQGLITTGSPLGFEIDFPGAKVFEKRKIESVRNTEFEVFPWHNYFNRLDPIVSANVFGSPVTIQKAKGPVERRYGADTMAAGWLLQGHVVTSGKQWLLAHTTYWKNPKIGDRLVDMLWG